MKKTGNENTQTYQVEVAILIQHQILITNLQGNEKHLESRIKNQILGATHQYFYMVSYMIFLTW